MSTIDQRMIALEQRLRMLIDQKTANVVYLSSVTLATSDGQEDGLAGRPGPEQSQRTVRRIQHSGFRSRPPVQSRAVAVSVEGGATKMITVGEDDGAVFDLAAGEARAYSPAKPACKIHFGADGAITATGAGGGEITIGADGTINVTAAAGKGININAGAGGVVQVNGSPKMVARVGDTAGPYPIVGANPYFMG